MGMVAGIDGLLKQEVNNLPAFVRVQRDCEALHETIAAIKKSTKDKGACCLVVIATLNDFPDQGSDRHSSSDVLVIPSTALSLSAHLGGDPNGGRRVPQSVGHPTCVTSGTRTDQMQLPHTLRHSPDVGFLATKVHVAT